MTFTVTRLVGNRALVQGTDTLGTSGKTVVDTTQWDDINGHDQYSQAEADFESAVNQFFGPLIEAAEKFEREVDVPSDPAGYVVLQEEVEATEGQERVIVQLTRDSMILRLIEQGETDRLVWVGDTLEVSEHVTDDQAQATVEEVLGATEVSDSEPAGWEG